MPSWRHVRPRDVVDGAREAIPVGEEIPREQHRTPLARPSQAASSPSLPIELSS